jgi:hypothetical protein
MEDLIAHLENIFAFFFCYLLVARSLGDVKSVGRTGHHLGYRRMG